MSSSFEVTQVILEKARDVLSAWWDTFFGSKDNGGLTDDPYMLYIRLSVNKKSKRILNVSVLFFVRAEKPIFKVFAFMVELLLVKRWNGVGGVWRRDF